MMKLTCDFNASLRCINRLSSNIPLASSIRNREMWRTYVGVVVAFNEPQLIVARDYGTCGNMLQHGMLCDCPVQWHVAIASLFVACK